MLFFRTCVHAKKRDTCPQRWSWSFLVDVSGRSLFCVALVQSMFLSFFSREWNLAVVVTFFVLCFSDVTIVLGSETASFCSRVEDDRSARSLSSGPRWCVWPAVEYPDECKSKAAAYDIISGQPPESLVSHFSSWYLSSSSKCIFHIWICDQPGAYC